MTHEEFYSFYSTTILPIANDYVCFVVFFFLYVFLLFTWSISIEILLYQKSLGVFIERKKKMYQYLLTNQNPSFRAVV